MVKGFEEFEAVNVRFPLLARDGRGGRVKLFARVPRKLSRRVIENRAT